MVEIIENGVGIEFIDFFICYFRIIGDVLIDEYLVLKVGLLCKDLLSNSFVNKYGF